MAAKVRESSDFRFGGILVGRLYSKTSESQGDLIADHRGTEPHRTWQQLFRSVPTLSPLFCLGSSSSLERMRVASLQTVRRLSSSAARTDCLAGTVPLHQAYILLHGRDSPRLFPSRVTSPLLVALQQYALRWSALVNVAWVPPSNSTRHLSTPPVGSQDTEAYSLLTFAHGRAGLQIPSVTMDNLDEVCSRLYDYMERPPTGVVDSDDLYLYVCTHGARDCRCGEWGGKVADALRNEVHQRKEMEPTGKYSRVVVGEVGHVGGHQ